MREVMKKKDSLIFKFPYMEALKDQIKAIPTSRYLPASKRWAVTPNGLNAEAILAVITDYHFNAGSAILTWLQKVHATKDSFAVLSKVEGIEEAVGDTPLARALRPFQRAGVLYASTAGKCIIADEMGLGKTIQGLATAEKRDAFPLVVVCPASLKINWYREAKTWLPQKVVRILQGRENHLLNGADIIICNYEILRHDIVITVPSKKLGILKEETKFPLVEAFKQYGVKGVILDESHYIKNPKAKQTKACIELCKKRDTVTLLTGTPVLNKPVEIIPQLRAIDRFTSLFGTWKSFVNRYCEGSQGDFGYDVSGASNLEELNEKLRATCLVRRTKSEVLKELPAKTISTVYTSLARSQDEYLRELQNVRAELDGQPMSELTILTRIEALKQCVVKAKLNFVKDWVTEFLESGQKLVLFGWHTEQVEELHKHFSRNSMTITGKTPMDKRQLAVDRFQDPGSLIRLLICNIKAAGVGLTLTAASNVAFYEFGWTPAEHWQAEDRVHRYGQTDAVTAYYLIAENTIDEWIIDVIEQKREIVEMVTDGSSEASTVKDVSMLKEIIQRIKS